MNILLINPNSHNPYTKPPLGLLSIATVCKRAGHNAVILDAALLNQSAYDVAVEAGKYDLIGLTAMTPMIGEAMDIAAEIKRLSQRPVVIGGVHATLFTSDLYLTGYFDSVIAGEGEPVILQALDDFKAKALKPFYKNGGYADIPIPDYSLIDINAYHPRHPHAEREPWTSVQTSRGCPFACTFCCNIFGKRYRAMSAEQVYSLLKQLSFSHGVKDITFYDDEFTIDYARVMKLCQLLIDKPVDIRWTCESRVDLVNRELLAAMKRAGCRLIFYGVETGDPTILRALNKRITFNQVRKAVKLTKAVGIKAVGYFMLGCPGETLETMEATVNLALELEMDHAQFSVCSPMPGTELYRLYGQGADWSSFQYLADGSQKVYCDTEVEPELIEAKVNEANAIFNKVIK